MARTVPYYVPQVAWSEELTGVFRADVSLADGPDVAPGRYGNNVYDTLPSVLEIQIDRGRSQPWSGVEQGTARLVLSDPDGIYDPLNAASPLVGLLDDMRPLKIPMMWAAGEYGLFAGFVSKIEHRPDLREQVTIIEAVDFTEWLATIKPVIASTGPATIGAAMGLVLDAAEWTDASLRDLDAGNTIPDFSADGSKTGLQIIADLIAVDLGMFYVGGGGVVTYRSRDSMFQRQTAVDTFAVNVLSKLNPAIDSRRVVNRQTVTRTGGTPQTAEYNPKRKPWRDGSLSSDYLNADSDAANLATWIVLYSGSVQTPIPVEIPDADDAQIASIVARELADLVQVYLPHGGSVDAVVQRISHRIAKGAGHLAGYTLAPRPVTMFTADVSLADGDDVAGY